MKPGSLHLMLAALLLATACAGCGGFNPFDTGPVYYTVTAIHTDPVVVHVGDVVTLRQTHSGGYDGDTLGVYTPITRWKVDRGYFLDATWSEWLSPVPEPGFDPHVAQRREIDRFESPHWLAPAEPGPVHITCLYFDSAPDEYCVPLTVEVEMQPAE